MKRFVKLTVAYDGTAYHGFQRQKNALTVQEVLEERLTPLFGEPLRLACAGRTDTGVHALGQVVHFATTGRIPLDRVAKASRGVLPPDIVVCRAEQVDESFHARKAAVAKRYVYHLLQQEGPHPFWHRYAWLAPKPLELEAMCQATQQLLGRHDFSSFRAAGGQPVQPVRTMFSAGWQQRGPLLSFHICGEGFLYHMVRNLVGALRAVGEGELSPEDFVSLLAARDRRLGPPTAPPQGLFLQEVFYRREEEKIYSFQGLDSGGVFY